jgi:hypothetical protein
VPSLRPSKGSGEDHSKRKGVSARVLDTKLDDDNYFQGIVSLFDQATDSSTGGKMMPPTPSGYAADTSVISGKPVALVNAGSSLELSQGEHMN